MTRIAIAIVFIVGAAFVVLQSFRAGIDTGTGRLYLNLGTEIFGIVLTVVIVDALIRAQRRRSSEKKLAHLLLVEIDEFVYHWLGGQPHFDPDGRVKQLSDAARVAPRRDIDIDALRNLGRMSRSLGAVGLDIGKASGELREACEAIEPFAYLRKEEEHRDVSGDEIVGNLMIALIALRKLQGRGS